MTKTRLWVCVTMLGSIYLLLSPHVQAGIPMEFKGELWEHPCELAPESQGQTVSFADLPVKNFQVQPGRSPAEKFSIQLNNCSSSTLYSSVKLAFDGVKEPNMGGESDYWLATGSGPNAGKLAIGILDSDGSTPLKLGDAHNHGTGTPLDSSTIVLNFSAVVQATPDALATKSVVPGDYRAQANFVLTYE